MVPDGQPLQGRDRMESQEGAVSRIIDTTASGGVTALLLGSPLPQDRGHGGGSGPARESQGAGPGSGSGHCPSLPLPVGQSQKRHVQETMAPLSHQDAKVVVKMLQNLTACPNVIGRFHTLHKLAPQHAAEVIPFSLQIQNRSAESQQMYMGFQRLSRSCATPPSARPA